MGGASCSRKQLVGEAGTVFVWGGGGGVGDILWGEGPWVMCVEGA